MSLVDAIKNKRSPIKWHTFYIFPAIYIVSLILSSILSADVSISAKSAFSNDWYLLILPLIASVNINEKTRKQAFLLLIISATIAGFYGIIQYFEGIEYYRNKPLPVLGNFYRAVGAYGFYLTYAGNQLLVFAVAMSFFLLGEKKAQNRVLLLISLLILFLSVIVTFGRSAWLGAGLVILLGTYITNRKLFGVSIVSIVIGSLILFFIFPEIQSRFTSIFDLSQNIGRVTLWKTSWAIFSHHPFFGIGQGLFSDYFQIFKVPGFYDKMGHAHNDYLNTAVYSGIVGLFSWIGMWISWFYFAIKSYVKMPNSNINKKILLAGILGLTGILFAAIFQCYYTDLENNLLWWFILTLGITTFLQEKHHSH
jgi:O-antigen ligase